MIFSHCAHALDLAFALGLDLALGQALGFGFPFSTALQATGRASAHGIPQDHAWDAISQIKSFLLWAMYSVTNLRSVWPRLILTGIAAAQKTYLLFQLTDLIIPAIVYTNMGKSNEKLFKWCVRGATTLARCSKDCGRKAPNGPAIAEVLQQSWNLGRPGGWGWRIGKAISIKWWRLWGCQIKNQSTNW